MAVLVFIKRRFTLCSYPDITALSFGRLTISYYIQYIPTGSTTIIILSPTQTTRMKPGDKKPGWNSRDEMILLTRSRAACYSAITTLSCQSRQLSAKIEELYNKVQQPPDLVFLMDEDASDVVQLMKLKEEKSEISIKLRKAYQELGSIEKRLSELVQDMVQPGESGC
jgi:hypothetical protein